MTDVETLKKGLTKLNLNINQNQFQKLLDYAQFVKEGNQWVHLVSKKDENRIVSKHIPESLAVVPHLPKGEISCADVGSGAGFPGIPVKIVRPEIEMTLIESKKKKALFLIETIDKLQMEKIKVIADRTVNIIDKYQYLLMRCVKSADRFSIEIAHLITNNSILLIIKDGKVLKKNPTCLPNLI